MNDHSPNDSHPPTDADRIRPAASSAATRDDPPVEGRRIPAIQGLSLVVMAVWPLLGTASNLPAGIDGLVLLLGGVTIILSVPIMMVTGSFPEPVTTGLVILLWVLVWLLPAWSFRRRLRSRRAVIVLLLVQSLFSLAQTVMGTLMWLAREV
ncbi:MAG: hypothetical protein CMJ34_14370 [Phycisphaerae bacterium]|nr:hypothetical protein [Phycisphaerae bacterium]